MKVSIDMQNMTFMHKHSNTRVVANLAYLECRHGAYMITDTDAKSFLQLTDMEMKMLYRNTTGGEVYFLGASLRAIISELVDRMPESDVNPYELDIQANLAPQGDPNGYKYVKGSFKPTVVTELFPPKLIAIKSDNEPLIAAQRRARYLDSNSSAAPRVAVAPHVTPRTPVPGNPKPAVAALQGPAPTSRQGGVKEIIWREADILWQKAGSPKDISIILKLRKEIMEHLEKNFSVKRNTSSNELGNWQKNKLA